MKRITTLLIVLTLSATPALADSHGGGKGMHDSGALSEKEIKALEAGKGMGMGKVAELNQYPGPKHVLEMADELELTEEQKAETQKLFGEMRSNAIPLGRKLIEAEQALERAFADKAVDAASLEAAVLEIGEMRARLRYVHLETHLRQRALLNEDQIASYDKLRKAQRGGPGKRMKGEGHGHMKGKGKGDGHGKSKEDGGGCCKKGE